MDKINCEIIRDLIPSYVDEMCSHATKKCVEEHIKECEQCREMIEVCKEEEKQEHEREMRQIDGFKKIRRQINLMKGICYILIGLGVSAFGMNRGIGSILNYYLIFLICIVALGYMTGEKARQHPAKRDWLVLVLSLIDIVLSIGLIPYCIHTVAKGKQVWGIADEKLGPFVHHILGIMFLLLIIGFIYLLIRMSRAKVNNKWMICLQMMGLFLLLAYVTLLRELNAIETFYGQFSMITVGIGGTGLIGAAIIIFREKGIKHQ